MTETIDFRKLFDGSMEHEIWENVLFKFQGEHYVSNFLDTRTPKIKSIFEDSTNKKNSFNSQNPSPTKPAEILNVLSKKSLPLISKITNNIKQSRDIYHASKTISLISKPILLFYAFEKLAQSLVLLTFDMSNTATYSHGISFPDNKSIEIKRQGLFQRFHDTFSNDPTVYLKDYSFNLEDLVNVKDFDVISSMNKHPSQTIVQVKEAQSGNLVEITEFDREFILMFSLSTLARYRANEWQDIIQGQNSEIINLINQSIHGSSILFPNFIVYCFYGPNFDSTYLKFS